MKQREEEKAKEKAKELEDKVRRDYCFTSGTPSLTFMILQQEKEKTAKEVRSAFSVSLVLPIAISVSHFPMTSQEARKAKRATRANSTKSSTSTSAIASDEPSTTSSSESDSTGADADGEESVTSEEEPAAPENEKGAESTTEGTAQSGGNEKWVAVKGHPPDPNV